jgi:thioredoxin domain-containing protein 5
MNLYRNGEFVEMFNDYREYDVLTEYLAKHAEPTVEPSVTSDEVTTSPQATPTPFHVQTSRAEANPDGKVLELDEKIFQRIVDEGPVFIKFFAPW